MMNPSEKVTSFIMEFEGFRDKAYQDSKGVWTCGYGHTLKVTPLTTCTKELALKWLEADIQSAVNDVNRLVKVPLTQNQFDSLVSFVYNVGGTEFSRSTLLRKLNTKNYDAVPAEMERYIYSGGQKIKGLVFRRRVEAARFAACLPHVCRMNILSIG